MPSRHGLIVGLALLLVPGCSPTVPAPSAPPAAVSAPKAAAPVAVKAGKTDQSPAAKPMTPDVLVGEAETAARAGKMEQALLLLDQALAGDPTHRKALVLEAEWAQKRAIEMERPASSPYYLKSAKALRKLHATYKDLNSQEQEALAPVLYNEACTYAVGNQPEKALDVLAESIDAGLTDTDLLAEDEELASIRSTARFGELTRKIERNAAERAAKTARKLVAENKPFPFRFELPDLDGKRVALDDIKGKLIIVDVWGTWCPPCRKELPHFKALLARYRDQGLAIVGINYERVADEDVVATIKAFVKEHDVPYTCLIGDDKTRDQIPEFIGYPTTLFLDRSGTARAKTVGYQSLFDLDAIVALLLRPSEQDAIR
jgi:thiol-disulfide isomerase/thioredoxin